MVRYVRCFRLYYINLHYIEQLSLACLFPERSLRMSEANATGNPVHVAIIAG